MTAPPTAGAWTRGASPQHAPQPGWGGGRSRPDPVPTDTVTIAIASPPWYHRDSSIGKLTLRSKPSPREVMDGFVA